LFAIGNVFYVSMMCCLEFYASVYAKGIGKLCCVQRCCIHIGNEVLRFLGSDREYTVILLFRTQSFIFSEIASIVCLNLALLHSILVHSETSNILHR